MPDFVKYFPLVILVYALTYSRAESRNRDMEVKLIDNLIKNYDNAQVLPNANPVLVHFRFSPTILLLDESSQELQLRGMLAMIWEDERLIWDPTEYGGLDMTHIPLVEDNKNCIWKPELVLNESIDKDSNDFHVETNVAKVFHNGTIQWYTLAMTTSYCRVNVQHFPFDKQTCRLTFTTWLYQTDEQRFCSIDDLTRNEGYKRYKEPSGVWDFEISSAQLGNASYDCSTCYGQEQSYVQYTLYLSRSNHAWYILNYMLPCIVLSVMTILILWLPHKDGIDASNFGLACILTLFVFLTFLFTQLPATEPPGIGFYIVWLIFEAVCATVYVTKKTAGSAGKNPATENNSERDNSMQHIAEDSESDYFVKDTESRIGKTIKVIKIWVESACVSKWPSWLTCKKVFISINIFSTVVFCICLLVWQRNARL